MALPLNVVALAFTIGALFCLIDAFMARPLSRRLFRGFQALAFATGAVVYWISMAHRASIPPPEIRLVLIVIVAFSVYEIISHWSFGGKRH